MSLFSRMLLCMVVVGALIAEDQVQFQPGVLAKIYACGKYPQDKPLTWDNIDNDVPGWPIKALPDAPVEVLRLKELPVVDATSLKEIINKSDPSLLVASKTGVLRGCNFYAVEFEGYFYAPLEGVYTFGVTSDDPVEVFVEGKSVLSSNFSASPVDGPTFRQNEKANWPTANLDDPRLTPTVMATQGSVRLSPNKFYHVVCTVRQRWLPAAKSFNDSPQWIRTTDLNRGAVFRATISNPDGKTESILLQLPVMK